MTEASVKSPADCQTPELTLPKMSWRSLFPTFLPKLWKMKKLPGLRHAWLFLYRRWAGMTQPVGIRLHGFPAWINGGNSYPFILAEVPTFNAPLVELVHQAFQAKGSPLVVVDIGSATGDTVLLLKERCQGHVGQFLCVEGDDEFFQLLNANTRGFPDVTRIKTLLAAESKTIPTLVKHHQGTASATGSDRIQASSLDSLPEIQRNAVDVIKIDVDGFDGEVLAGSKNLLQRCQPAVIFEWHPKLLQNTGNSPVRAFETLRQCGYTRFLWFQNNGAFSHFSEADSPEVLAKEIDYLLQANYRCDEHFDIIGLPQNSKIKDVDLALASYARRQAGLA